MTIDRQSVGSVIRRTRKAKGLSLDTLSELAGITASTLSRIETGKVSATFDRVQGLASALGVGVADLFAVGHRQDAERSRRAISRGSRRARVRSAHYEYETLCWEFNDQAIFPVVARLLHRDLAGFGPLVKHPGQEFIYVLKGRARIVTEQYEETILDAGDALYIDSTMGHAFLDASDDGHTLILGGATEKRLSVDD
jgi:transcriptional regulator with XRE-family HTH domain